MSSLLYSVIIDAFYPVQSIPSLIYRNIGKIDNANSLLSKKGWSGLFSLFLKMTLPKGNVTDRQASESNKKTRDDSQTS